MRAGNRANSLGVMSVIALLTLPLVGCGGESTKTYKLWIDAFDSNQRALCGVVGPTLLERNNVADVTPAVTGPEPDESIAGATSVTCGWNGDGKSVAAVATAYASAKSANETPATIAEALRSKLPSETKITLLEQSDSGVRAVLVAPDLELAFCGRWSGNRSLLLMEIHSPPEEDLIELDDLCDGTQSALDSLSA